MNERRQIRRICQILFFILTTHLALAHDSGRSVSTAWRNNQFHMHVAGVVSRSDIVLQRPNVKREDAMPLGNGRLGLAVWSEDGLTIQLNRADTLPHRLSPGQLVLPGLKHLVEAADYSGRLDIYRGEFKESGGGMTATVYVQPDPDVAVIEVHGANPNSMQAVTLHLWRPRHPDAAAQRGIAVLSETWKDATEAGATGETFGSLAAITGDARDLRAEVEGPLAVKLSFRPKPDGSFRVLIAAPEWNGGDAIKRATAVLRAAGKISAAEHRQWWQNFWQHAGLMKLASADGSAEYFENLRCIDLFTAAAESLGHFPGSQAGVGDLFSALRDEHQWSPSAYWHWNLRMQVAANLGAGLYGLNDSYFNLYRDNLQNIEKWTKAQMDRRPGACVPETMRFNGKGYENETWMKSPGLDCSAKSKPYYNARTLTTGAEVSLWVWRQYLDTQDKDFLTANYPLMAASARFLLSYAKQGSDGLLHTYPANAHETQWDVHDPTTDIAAMKSLFPAVIAAAHVLKRGGRLVHELQAALSNIPKYPLKHDAGGKSIIGLSYDENAPIHNTENIGLEVVWPYALIGDAGPLHALGVRTYGARPNKFQNDWSFDPIQAARLGLADELKTALMKLTGKYQQYPSGFAKFAGPEFYVEQIGVVAAALQQALVQDNAGLIRIAPAWPKEWDADGIVYVRRRSKVDVQIRNGVPVTVVFEAGATGETVVRNPWPGIPVEVVVSGSGQRITEASGTSPLRFDAEAGKAYLIQPVSRPNGKLRFVAIDGIPSSKPKSLGIRHIGLP